jgi:hypothetical protein
MGWGISVYCDQTLLVATGGGLGAGYDATQSQVDPGTQGGGVAAAGTVAGVMPCCCRCLCVGVGVGVPVGVPVGVGVGVPVGRGGVCLC